ncbi:MAG: hypothetical protein JNJ41_11460 [Bacteroidia bacterium]|nr:hypothetical protein [Bacteroidia bacterium]
MDYYKSNALYEHLTNINNPKFTFCSGNIWQLVYGDSNSNPKLLVLLIGIKQSEIGGLFDPNQSAYRNLKYVSDNSKIPLIVVQFINDVPEIENVYVLKDDHHFISISLIELTEIFKNNGLPIKASSTAKYLNDKSSSAYHNWQRNSLGYNITVTDIDLWEIQNLIPQSVFELKRSYINMESWKPYTDDYANFRLLANLVIPIGIGFKIIYNKRIKIPFTDIIDPLKIFDVGINPTLSISNGVLVPLNEFTK